MEKLYTAKATTTGGRNGHVKSDNGVLDIEVKTPKQLGGASDAYLNPEMLFAGGYSACFGSALDGVIRKEKLSAGTTSVTAEVSLGKIDENRYGLAVTLTVEIPGVDKEVAKELAEKAHQVCPYSNAVRGNVEVRLLVK